MTGERGATAPHAAAASDAAIDSAGGGGGAALERVLREVATLRGAVEGLRGAVEGLRGDVVVALDAVEGDAAAKGERRVRKRKRRKKEHRRDSAGWNWTRVAIGLLPVASLASAALGRVILGEIPSLIPAQRSGGRDGALEGVDEAIAPPVEIPPLTKRLLRETSQKLDHLRKLPPKGLPGKQDILPMPPPIPLPPIPGLFENIDKATSFETTERVSSSEVSLSVNANIIDVTLARDFALGQSESRKRSNQPGRLPNNESPCEEGDESCQCLRRACARSLAANSAEFCEDAEAACCDADPDPSCGCGLYEGACVESPGQFGCDLAAERCCRSRDDDPRGSVCLCDFYTAASDILNDDLGYGVGNCSEAVESQITSPNAEREALVAFYDASGGEHWSDNARWLDAGTPHCSWFGLKCNYEGLLVSMNMRSNNVSGSDSFRHLAFPLLKFLDLAENRLTGELSSDRLSSLRRLEWIDLSGNDLAGHADLTLPPAVTNANYSSNSFTSAGFRRFNPAYETLRAVDLSDNLISHEATKFFDNVPPNLMTLVLSNNDLRGALPDPFPLEDIRTLEMANNAIDGALLTLPTPRLRRLDLSGQAPRGGLAGRIPPSFFSPFEELSHLNLAGNRLAGRLPPGLSGLGTLSYLNLSSNSFEGGIDPGPGFKRLRGTLKSLDLSDNELSGRIPQQLVLLKLDDFRLGGNPNMLGPAPLDLCVPARPSIPGAAASPATATLRVNWFDLEKDARMCPPERNALRKFYHSAKGGEWTESTSWLDQVTSHCEWYGVTCEEGNTTRLELRNNGLSGKLSEEIGVLTSLEVLDLSDNDIKGSIPAEIGNLVNLKHLRLCYNEFIGNTTDFGNNLRRLELLQVHGNRLSGTIPKLNVIFSDSSSYVSDCGNPSDFEESLTCKECTMCCNGQGDCFPTQDNVMQKVGFQSYMQFTGVFLAVLCTACALLAAVVYAYEKHKNRHLQPSQNFRASLLGRYQEYALEWVGHGSVYQFFLGRSRFGWFIVLLTMVVQFWLLFIFVEGSEKDWASDKSDLVYTWKCPRDQAKCTDRGDLDWQGWLAFVILMVVHLLKDVINGGKLIVLSAKERHSRPTRMRHFFGGMLLTTVSSLTFYVSTIYNGAIATNNREIIENSVIILLIFEIDEYVYKLLKVISHDWVMGIKREVSEVKVNDQETTIQRSWQGGSNKDDGSEESLLETGQNRAYFDQLGGARTLEGDMQDMKIVVKRLEDTVNRQNAELKKLLGGSQNESALQKVGFQNMASF